MAFDFSKGHASAGGPDVQPRKPHEPTAEEKAQHTANVAANLDRYQRGVTEGVAAMIVAEAQGDVVGWERAHRRATLAMQELRDAAQPAFAMRMDAADAEVQQRLTSAVEVVGQMAQQLASAPAAPEKKAPELSCADSLLAALPPDRPVSGAHAVFERARRAVETVFRAEMTFKDLEAFSRILSEFRSHEIARRFARFGDEKQAALRAVLQESKVRARARARGEALARAAAQVQAPAGFTPPTIDKPAEYEEQRATIDIGGGELDVAEREPVAAPAVPPDAEAAVPRANGTAMDMPAAYEESRATIDIDGGHTEAEREQAAAAAALPDAEGAVARANGTAMDVPAAYDESRATIDIDGGGAGAERPPSALPDAEGAAARASGTAMDMPAAYEDTRATIDIDGGRAAADRPALPDAEGAVARANGTAIDMPAVYEESRATIDNDADRATAEHEHAAVVTSARGADERRGDGRRRGPGAQPATQPAPAAARMRGGASAALRDPTGNAILDTVERALAQVDAQVARLPALARNLQVSVGHVEVDGVVGAGLRLMETLDAVERDLGAQSESLQIAADAQHDVFAGGVDSLVLEARGRIIPLRERHQQLTASLLLWKQTIANQCGPSTFRFEPVPGVPPSVPPSFSGATFAGFLQREIARTVVLVSTVDEVRLGLAMLEPGSEPPRSLIDLVERWMGDRSAFLFLRHVLGALGLSTVLGATTRNGQTVDARAEAVARGVPQLAHQIVETIEAAREIHDSANPAYLIQRHPDVADPRAVATEMVALAMERMRELGASPALREAIQAGGGGGWSQGGVAEVVQLAEERVASLQFALRQGVKNATGAFNQAITAVRVAAVGAYPLATGEMGFAESPLAGIDDRAGLGVGDEVATAMLLLPIAAEIALTAPAIIATLTTRAATNPGFAYEVIGFAATLGLQIGEGGVEAFLDSLTTPEGIVQLVADVLALKQAAGSPPRTARARAHVEDAGGMDVGSTGSRVFDLGAKIKAKLHAWGKRFVDDPVAVTSEGTRTHVDDGKSNDHVYASRLAEIRGGAAAAGAAFYRPGPQLRRAAYHPPDPDASVADLAQQLANESRAETPVLSNREELKKLSNEERAAAYQKQVDYFDHVERQANHRQAQLRLQGDPEAPDAPQWLREEFEAAKRLEAAAKIKPVAGKLPQNYGKAGDELTIDEIREHETRPGLAEQAIAEIEARGLTGIRYTEDAFVDLDPFIYRQGDVVGDVPIALQGSRTPDFSLANAEMKKMDPNWRQPPGWTWHHHEREGRMILVPTAVHRVATHTGGAAKYRHRTGDLEAYSKKGG